MPNTVADPVIGQGLQASPVSAPGWVHVVAAVIRGQGQCVLLARRPAHKHQGGKWEFPGGKVEVAESAVGALVRELREELGIEAAPEAMRPLLEVRHSYPDKHVWLDVWDVSQFAGEPQGLEGQEVAWFDVPALMGLDFPAANMPIIQALTAGR